jgi:hypothetical protein
MGAEFDTRHSRSLYRTNPEGKQMLGASGSRSPALRLNSFRREERCDAHGEVPQAGRAPNVIPCPVSFVQGGLGKEYGDVVMAEPERLGI